MTDITTIVILVITVAVIAVGALLLMQWQKRRALRQRFGPEYDHTVKTTGDRKLAERELRHRIQHVKEAHLRELEPREKRDLASRWRGIQVDFVDNPEDAVETADRLVTEAMRLRGYPEGNFEQRVADASVEHPHLASDYREARRLAETNRRGGASTEDLRRAMVCYRSIFQALLGHDEVGPVESTATAPRREMRR
jgi:hypothetical protein